MAGDWIKMQHATPDKPEVMKMAKILRVEPEQVVGHLVRVWSWLDQQSLNGHDLDVTDVDVDRVARHTGFATALRSVNWLTGNPQALSFPNFDRHNGESAKKRALAADRKRRERSREERDESVSRGEERKEEGTTTTPPTPTALQATESKTKEASHSTSRRTRLELTELPDTWRLWAAEKCATVDALAAFEKFRNHHLAKGSLMADWPAAWRTWCGREVEFASGRGAPGLGKQAALEARNAAVAAAWSPPVDEAAR